MKLRSEDCGEIIDRANNVAISGVNVIQHNSNPVDKEENINIRNDLMKQVGSSDAESFYRDRSSYNKSLNKNNLLQNASNIGNSINLSQMNNNVSLPY